MKLLLLTKSSVVLLAAGIVVMVRTQSAHADGPPSLPPEAYAACASKNDGDVCIAQLRDREIHGTCAPDREGRVVFCRPQEMPLAPAPPARLVTRCVDRNPEPPSRARMTACKQKEPRS